MTIPEPGGPAPEVAADHLQQGLFSHLLESDAFGESIEDVAAVDRAFARPAAE